MKPVFHRLIILSVAGLVHFGCSSDDKNSPDEGAESDFVSANPNRPGVRGDGDAVGAPAPGSTGGGGAANDGGSRPPGESADDPGRAIEEADIVQKSADRLYALSQYGGLSVIDIGTRDRLELLGRYKTDAVPFEMYLRDGDVVVALFNSYGTYVYDEETEQYTWAQASRVVALDVSDPTNIDELASFTIPGAISDSRIVGNVLYVIGFEESYCWGCSERPATTILSLDISNPLEAKEVDRLRYEDEDSDYGWMRRSVTATDKRLYVAGAEYSRLENTGSTIHVVDISDPRGTLKEVAQVEAEGEISSRWQMDEYDGILRVVSQPPTWDLSKPPVVQTWSIGNDNKLEPLGRTELVLPRPELLQSVRFDGLRGYAITFERTDPLFTIDLSDPEKPKQVGELEMPGFLYHMEPRGDRLIGLGLDRGNDSGGLTVSLFDVSDLAAPKMLDRVNFGGNAWATLAEDQDRIHKSFNILDAIGTILVPFSGYTYDSYAYCGQYQSGVQLIDYDKDEDKLTLRGVAASRGQARRGLLHDERLLTVSDDRVQLFDLKDRDAPRETASVTLTNNVVKSVIVKDHVVRLTNDWWTMSPRLEIVSLDDATNPVPLSELDLGLLVDDASRTSCYSWSYPRELFANEQYAYLVYEHYVYDYYADAKNTIGVVVVDVSNPKRPTFVAKHSVTRSGYSGYYSAYGLAGSGSDIVQLGSTLALLSTETTCIDPDCTRSNVKSVLDIVDLSTPSKPRSVSLNLPVALGNTGLITSGNIIATSHFAPVDNQGERVRFFLDRFDVSDPSQPVALPPKNIPGSLLEYDANSDNAITVDYRSKTERVANSGDCYDKYGYSARFISERQGAYDGPGTCYAIEQSLKLVGSVSGTPRILGSYDLAPGEVANVAATGDDRTFVALSGSLTPYYGDIAYEGYGWYRAPNVERPVIVIAGLKSGKFATGEVAIKGGYYWPANSFQAVGTRAILSAGWRNQLTVLDATDATAPVVAKEVNVKGYVSDVDVFDNSALLSLGYDGAEVVDLD